jgi:DMSO/TMAO reductase YedYZ molybdopterin-dependent catalytic subunit
LFTDLAAISTEQLVTPTERFFVRTATPPSLPDPAAWKVECGGLVDRPGSLESAAFEKLPTRSGRYLIECAGNADPDNYGLISVADWQGVPLAAILQQVGDRSTATRVLISGFDIENTPQQTSRTSVPGASWVFARDDLQQALLAIRMNGAPLTREHGSPLRLVVPGWYGCACIKWVNRIDLVDDEAAATTQMMEFAQRTHQPGRSERARDYLPATIDTAAVPIRVERWEVAGKTQYRVIGIIWGGQTPTNALAIRFKTGEPWTRVDNCPMPATTLTWSLWTHNWRPIEPGRYEIVLKVTDPAIRTRRLDLFYYVRTVTIDAL